MMHKCSVAFALIVSVFSLFSARCTVGPSYTAPEPPTDLIKWHQSPKYGLIASPTDVSQSGNLDLEKAPSRVRVAQSACVSVAMADLYPRFTFNEFLQFVDKIYNMV